jgi:hypothetical protein
MASHELHIGGPDSIVLGIVNRYARVDRTAFAGRVCGVLACIGRSRTISDPVLHEAFPRCTTQGKWP